MVELQVGPAVRSVRLFAGEQDLATIVGPPWRAVVNFGPALTPRTLVAIAHDANGGEVARAEQLLNVPRPPAEVEILVRHDEKGTPVAAAMRWRHIENQPMRSAELKLDDKPLVLDKEHRATLPAIDLARPHVLSAAVRFARGFVARQDMVIGGAWSATEPAELTPVLVHQNRDAPQTPSACFSVDGDPVRIATVERAHGLLLIVRDPDPSEAITAIDPAARTRNRGAQDNILRRSGTVDKDVVVEMIWPVTRSYGAAGQPTAELFAHTEDLTPQASGIPYLLTRVAGPLDLRSAPYRWADAVAVAAIDSMTRARRRAVVLVLSRDRKDESRYDAQTVRRYLRDTGTPFFVWSPTGPRPELEATWGRIEDVSTRARLLTAIQRVNEEMARQRIAWVQTGRLAALRLKADPACPLTPAAQ